MKRKQFVINIFSSDSTEIYDNKLSRFTVEFDQPIDLTGGEWEVALKSIVVGAISTAKLESDEHNDTIILDNTREQSFKSLQDFCDMLITHCVDPSIYTPEYFIDYLSTEIQWEIATLNQFFPKDRVHFDGSNKVFATTDFFIKHVYSENETKTIKVPKHLNSTIDTYDHFKIKLGIPLDKSPFTLLKILNLFIRYFLSGFRESRVAHEEYLGNFVAAASSYESFSEMLKAFQEHKKHGNLIVQRLIQKFVSCVQESRKKLSSNNTSITQGSRCTYMFVYCDAVEAIFCGSSKSKLLKICAFLPNIKPQGELSNILEYQRVEKKLIKSLSFELRNETGELIDFVGSRTPTLLTLAFRRVSEGGENF